MEEEGSPSPPPLSLSDPPSPAPPTEQPPGFVPYCTGSSSTTTTGAAKDLVDQQTQGYYVRPHERPPPMYQATLGLAAAYKRITEDLDRRRPRAFSTSETHLYTSDDGTLRLGPHLPLLLGRYRFVRLVGQGTFAQIVCAEDTFHPRRRQVAIKILNLHYGEIGKREALCLRLVHDSPEGPHSGVVRFHAVFDFMGHFCIVMELCLGGSFQTYVRPLNAASPPLHHHAAAPPGGGGPGKGGLSVPQLREAALHLVKALLLLHNHDVIHADLKPENVLLAGGGPGAMAMAAGDAGLGPQVRLTDLGNAIKSREVKLYKEDYEIQTLGYRAPEVLLGGCGGKAFDHQIDMWSLGVMLVELYLGRPLFRAASKVLMVKRVVSVLGPLPARHFVTGKFYTAFFGPDHRLRPETFTLRDDPAHAATALTDPEGVQNSFVYDADAHYRLVCDLLRTRDTDFISFICGLLQLDPGVRLSAFQALMHPFLAPHFPFTLLKPFLTPASTEALLKSKQQPLTALAPGSSSSSSSRHPLAGPPRPQVVTPAPAIAKHEEEVEELKEVVLKSPKDEEEETFAPPPAAPASPESEDEGPGLSPDLTPALPLEDSPSPPPISLDVESKPAAKEKRKPAAKKPVPATSSTPKKRPRENGGSGSGGGGGGKVGGAKTSTPAKARPGAASSSAASSSQTPSKKWYEDEVEEEDEDDDDLVATARSSSSSSSNAAAGKKMKGGPPPPLSRARQEEADEDDSAGEDELLL